MDVIIALLGTFIGGGFIIYAFSLFDKVEGKKKGAAISVGILGTLFAFALVGVLRSLVAGNVDTGTIVIAAILLLVVVGCIIYIKKF